MSETQDQKQDRRQTPRAGARERRVARPLRDHVAAWFNTLRDELSKDPENARLVMGMKAWRRPEDIMLDCPVLLPLVLEMAWRRRAEPAFQSLFLKADGTPATDTSDILALSGASYTQLGLACLTGAARIHCARREQEWLNAERNNGSLLAAVSRLFGVFSKAMTARLLKKYSRRGLLEVLKPHLTDASQFEALAAYTMLSTRTAEALGPRLRGMTDSAAIETFAGLDEPTARFAITLADAYAAAVADTPQEEELGLSEPSTSRVNASTAAGRALTDMLEEGTAVLRNAKAEPKAAVAVLQKMAAALGKDVWQVMSHAGQIENIGRCSPPIAFGFGTAAAMMDPAVARVLDGINDDAVAKYFALQLVHICGAEKVTSWVDDAEDIQVWRSIVMDINTSFMRPAHGAELNDNEQTAIRALCAGIDERFVIAEPEASPETVENEQSPAHSAPERVEVPGDGGGRTDVSDQNSLATPSQ